MPDVEEKRPERKLWTRVLGLVTVIGVVGFAAVTIGTGRLQVASEVDKTIVEVPDCQCISACYAKGQDKSKRGTWCHSATDISPCMDATGQVTYGKSWSYCKITYGEDDCADNPCKNNAFCLDGYDSFTCVCRPGWTGPACDREKLTEYTVSIATASALHSETKNPIAITFTGQEGDTTKEVILAVSGAESGLGRFNRPTKGGCPEYKSHGDFVQKGFLQVTVTAQDVGTLHKVTYRVTGDDSFKPAFIRVENKGVVYTAVGKLNPSESAAPVAVTVVKARKYKLKIKALDDPNWSATTDDVSVQLTGKNWEVTGEVVVLPGGIGDGTDCELDFYGADVGTPAKVTYWVSGKDSFLPTNIKVDGRYKAQITTGNQCIVPKADGTIQFKGDQDKGKGYAFKDSKCPKDKTTDGCTGYEGCRSCVLWDPDTKKDEVLCPWVLPYTDGRYIIVDLVDKMKDKECKLAADPVLANGKALPATCKKDAVVKSGKSCALECKAGYTLTGTQPKCEHGTFHKGTLKCTLTTCEAKACNGPTSLFKLGLGEYCIKDEKMCCNTAKDKKKIDGFTCDKPPCWSKGKECPGQCKVDADVTLPENAVEVAAADIKKFDKPALSCKKDTIIQNGGVCQMICKTGYKASGKAPSCSGGTFSKGDFACKKE